MHNSPPQKMQLRNICVIRDDLYPGGTKARFIPALYDDCDEIVYASPAQGGAQFALAYVAHQLNKRATIFVARRKTPHPRAAQVMQLGAKLIFVDNPRLSNVQAKAREYAKANSAKLAPFGFDYPFAIDVIAQAAQATNERPDFVYCAAGSGTLCRALQKAFPNAKHIAIAVGRDQKQLTHVEVIRYARPFESHALIKPPFPCDPHYDAKAYEIAVAQNKDGKILFWNVAGGAPT